MIPLLPLAELPDPGSRGLTASWKGETVSLFVVRVDGVVAAYLNRCPHRNLPLEWEPHRFLTSDKRHILCAVHGAVFRPHDGFCLFGPCSGASLPRLPVVERDGMLFLTEASTSL